MSAPHSSLLAIIATVMLVACGNSSNSSSSAANQQLPIISIAVSPMSATVGAGAVQQFVAAVSGTGDSRVNWQVNGISGGNETVGTIDSNGVYTAPLSPPAGGTAAITATSVADPTKSAAAIAKVVFSNASFTGTYALGFNGSDSMGDFVTAGWLHPSGNGAVTGTIHYTNPDGNVGVSVEASLSGTYSVAADGRGILTASTTPATVNGSSDLGLRFTLHSRQGGSLIADSTNVQGRGALELRNGTSFSAGSLEGSYVFSMTYLQLYTTGSLGGLYLGRILLDGQGVITNGETDTVFGQAKSYSSWANGTYSLAADGRGEMMITDSGGSLRVKLTAVSASRLLITSISENDLIFGQMEKQTCAGGTCLAGDYGLFGTGDQNASPVYAAGPVRIAGRMSAQTGAITNGVFDMVAGSSVLASTDFDGGYDLTPTGRGMLSMRYSGGTFYVLFYSVDPEHAFFTLANAGWHVIGELRRQAAGPYSTASMKATYQLMLVGEHTNLSGSVQADGNGNFTGTADVIESGLTYPATAIRGTYSIAANGRGLATAFLGFDNEQIAIYVLSAQQAWFLGLDLNHISSGEIRQQY